MKHSLFLLFFLFSFQMSFAQVVINYDYSKNNFSNSQKLPAEEQFALSGEVPPTVSRVEINIYSKNALSQKKPRPLFTGYWQRGFDAAAKNFYVPIAFKLKGGTEYDFVIDYYRQSNREETQNLQTDLKQALNAYLSQSLILEKKKISLTSRSGEMLNDMNAIVREGFSYYRSPANLQFEGFSDLIADKLSYIEKAKISKGKRLFAKKTKEEALVLNREKNIEELKAMVNKEVSYLFNAGVSVLAESRTIDNAESEKTRNVITVHGGYSGIFLNRGGVDYESGFNAGLTIPFGKRDLAKPFWSKTALVAGIYFSDFKLNDGERATGPFIGLPYYVGVGYKIVPYVRLIGGLTILQSEYDDTVPNIDRDEDIYFKPFVGLTIDLDIWLGIRK